MDKKASILIVDDDHGMTETLSDIFSELGHEVIVAGDGFEALELVRERDFDVAFIDIKLDGMNGVETFRRIKRIRAGLKVVMMTAYAHSQLIEEARREGASDVLYKPLDIDEMMPLITLRR